MSFLEMITLLGCCPRGPNSSSVGEKKRGPSVCPRRSTLGTCDHTVFTAWWSGMFDLNHSPFVVLRHCLNFLSNFCFQVNFIVFSGLVVQFYVDTVKKMAHSHFVSGSPLRTLCLLICWTTDRCFQCWEQCHQRLWYIPSTYGGTCTVNEFLSS